MPISYTEAHHYISRLMRTTAGSTLLGPSQMLCSFLLNYRIRAVKSHLYRWIPAPNALYYIILVYYAPIIFQLRLGMLNSLRRQSGLSRLVLNFIIPACQPAQSAAAVSS
jgi:hypothetical protein